MRVPCPRYDVQSRLERALESKEDSVHDSGPRRERESLPRCSPKRQAEAPNIPLDDGLGKALQNAVNLLKARQGAR